MPMPKNLSPLAITVPLPLQLSTGLSSGTTTAATGASTRQRMSTADEENVQREETGTRDADSTQDLENVILEDDYDPNYEPTREEILDYAAFLEMNLEEDEELMWIAREGLKAPLPVPWKACRTDDDEIYYFNFETGESVWEHPCDDFYKQLYNKEKQKLLNKPASKPHNVRRISFSDDTMLHDSASQKRQATPMVKSSQKLSPEPRSILKATKSHSELPTFKTINQKKSKQEAAQNPKASSLHSTKKKINNSLLSDDDEDEEEEKFVLSDSSVSSPSFSMSSDDEIVERNPLNLIESDDEAESELVVIPQNANPLPNVSSRNSPISVHPTTDASTSKPSITQSPVSNPPTASSMRQTEYNSSHSSSPRTSPLNSQTPQVSQRSFVPPVMKPNDSQFQNAKAVQNFQQSVPKSAPEHQPSPTSIPVNHVRDQQPVIKKTEYARQEPASHSPISQSPPPEQNQNLRTNQIPTQTSSPEPNAQLALLDQAALERRTQAEKLLEDLQRLVSDRMVRAEHARQQFEREQQEESIRAEQRQQHFRQAAEHHEKQMEILRGKIVADQQAAQQAYDAEMRAIEMSSRDKKNKLVQEKMMLDQIEQEQQNRARILQEQKQAIALASQPSQLASNYSGSVGNAMHSATPTVPPEMVLKEWKEMFDATQQNMLKTLASWQAEYQGDQERQRKQEKQDVKEIVSTLREELFTTVQSLHQQTQKPLTELSDSDIPRRRNPKKPSSSRSTDSRQRFNRRKVIDSDFSEANDFSDTSSLASPKLEAPPKKHKSPHRHSHSPPPPPPQHLQQQPPNHPQFSAQPLSFSSSLRPYPSPWSNIRPFHPPQPVHQMLAPENAFHAFQSELINSKGTRRSLRDWLNLERKRLQGRKKELQEKKKLLESDRELYRQQHNSSISEKSPSDKEKEKEPDVKETSQLKGNNHHHESDSELSFLHMDDSLDTSSYESDIDSVSNHPGPKSSSTPVNPPQNTSSAPSKSHIRSQEKALQKKLQQLKVEIETWHHIKQLLSNVSSGFTAPYSSTPLPPFYQNFYDQQLHSPHFLPSSSKSSKYFDSSFPNRTPRYFTPSSLPLHQRYVDKLNDSYSSSWRLTSPLYRSFALPSSTILTSHTFPNPTNSIPTSYSFPTSVIHPAAIPVRSTPTISTSPVESSTSNAPSFSGIASGSLLGISPLLSRNDDQQVDLKTSHNSSTIVSTTSHPSAPQEIILRIQLDR